MPRLSLPTVLLSLALGAAPAAAETVTSEKHRFTLTVLSDELDHPWALAFLPNGDMLVTERSGSLRIFRGGKLDPTPIAGVPEVAAVNQGGLLDVALDPDFAENRTIYLSFSAPGSGGQGTEVARARLAGGRLEDVKVILEAGNKSGGGRHFGSRLVFDRDGFLYVTSGDRGTPDRSQDNRDLAGTVSRIKSDGSVPPDNPFVGKSGARPEIFTYGHRSPQGLALHPETGRLWQHEHGPRGGDELNLLEPGANYGWPVITYGKSYAGFKIGEGTAKPGMEQPVRYWVPSISPSGMSFYTGKAFPNWQGNLFLGALSAGVLVRLELDGETVVHEERMLEDFGERIRDVRQGPDGKLYILTDSSDGMLIRLDPAS